MSGRGLALKAAAAWALLVWAGTGPATLAAAEKPSCRLDRTLVVEKGGAGTRVAQFVTMQDENPAAATSALVRWDDEGLHVLFECTDTVIVGQDRPRDGEGIWRDDSVEIFLDLRHSHDLNSQWCHVIVSALGCVWDEQGGVTEYFSSGDPMGGYTDFDVNGLKAKAERTPQGWRADVSIPWEGIGTRPSAGDAWGLNLNRTEHPAGEHICFSPTFSSFYSIDQWGHIVFTADGQGAEAGRARIAATHELLTRLHELQENVKMFYLQPPSPGRTWTEIAGRIYGARADERGPIGGGMGYARILTRGDYTARSVDELLDALSKARAGEVIFIPGGVEIDCTVRVHIEKLVFEVPAGVTLASNRGEGRSQGAMIYSDEFATRPLIRALGPNVRITGLRLRGPDPKPRLDHHDRSFAEGRGHEYYYKFPVSEGIHTACSGLEVDNCEIAGWSHAAVMLSGGEGHQVHHNFIHHNQYNGLGYGVCHAKAFSLIEQNLFDYNRHSIAGTGEPPSGYEARNNVELGHSLSHCFDMHGGADRQDGTNTAGTWMRVHHNTFRPPQAAVVFRGVPEQEAEVYGNWFRHEQVEQAVRHQEGTRVHDNACGLTCPTVCP